MTKLLANDEMLDAINTIHLTKYSDDPAVQLNQQNYRILELYDTQNRLYAESVIGEDEEELNQFYYVKNELRAEQRARIR